MNLRFLAACLVIPGAIAQLTAQQGKSQGPISAQSEPSRDAISMRLLDGW
jgi:hypothetical protein